MRKCSNHESIEFNTQEWTSLFLVTCKANQSRAVYGQHSAASQTFCRTNCVKHGCDEFVWLVFSVNRVKILKKGWHPCKNTQIRTFPLRIIVGFYYYTHRNIRRERIVRIWSNVRWESIQFSKSHRQGIFPNTWNLIKHYGCWTILFDGSMKRPVNDFKKMLYLSVNFLLIDSNVSYYSKRSIIGRSTVEYFQ